MASNIKVSIKPSGARELLNSPEVQKDLLRRARSIAGAARAFGPGIFGSDVQAGKNRAHAMVKLLNRDAIVTNAKTNALLKSIDAGRQ